MLVGEALKAIMTMAIKTNKYNNFTKLKNAVFYMCQNANGTYISSNAPDSAIIKFDTYEEANEFAIANSKDVKYELKIKKINLSSH